MKRRKVLSCVGGAILGTKFSQVTGTPNEQVVSVTIHAPPSIQKLDLYEDLTPETIETYLNNVFAETLPISIIVTEVNETDINVDWMGIGYERERAVVELAAKSDAPTFSQTIHTDILLSLHGGHSGIGTFQVSPEPLPHLKQAAIAWVDSSDATSIDSVLFTIAHEIGHNLGITHLHANAFYEDDMLKSTLMIGPTLFKLGTNLFGQDQPELDTIKINENIFPQPELNPEISIEHTVL